MTIRTEGFDGAGERDGAADADASLFVGAFDADAEEVLQEGMFGGVGGEDEDVVVGFVELGGDGEVAFGDAGVCEELLEFLGADGGELQLAGVEFAEHLLEGVVVVLGHLGDAVVGGDVADLLGAIGVSLAFDGNLPSAAPGHHDEAVALGHTPGERGDDSTAAEAVASDDGLVAIELLCGMHLGILRAGLLAPQFQRGGIDDLVVQAEHGDAGSEAAGLGRTLFMGSTFFGHA